MKDGLEASCSEPDTAAGKLGELLGRLAATRRQGAVETISLCQCLSLHAGVDQRHASTHINCHISLQNNEDQAFRKDFPRQLPTREAKIQLDPGHIPLEA